MKAIECGSTDPVLIGRVGDWADDSAWRRFEATYRPAVRDWGRRHGMAGDDAEELAQVVMVELTRRMPGFRYDPSRTFRGWLRALVRSRAIDLIRRRREVLALRDEDEAAGLAGPPGAESTAAGTGDRLGLLAAEVERAVRERVEPESWRIFWLVRVEGWSVAEAAEAVGKTYAAAYRNQQRVARMLREEASRQLGTDSTERH